MQLTKEMHFSWKLVKTDLWYEKNFAPVSDSVYDSIHCSLTLLWTGHCTSCVKSKCDQTFKGNFPVPPHFASGVGHIGTHSLGEWNIAQKLLFCHPFSRHTERQIVALHTPGLTDLPVVMCGQEKRNEIFLEGNNFVYDYLPFIIVHHFVYNRI